MDAEDSVLDYGREGQVVEYLGAVPMARREAKSEMGGERSNESKRERERCCDER